MVSRCCFFRVFSQFCGPCLRWLCVYFIISVSLFVPGFCQLDQITTSDCKSATGVQFIKRSDDIEVLINGKLFTRYVFRGTPKPFCFPIIAPNGKSVTRSYPMLDAPNEPKDHPHHRSLWFAFGDVNGVDFWSESAHSGRIVHRKFEKLTQGPLYGRIRALNDWIAPNGKKICEDTRDICISTNSSSHIIDFYITIRASEGSLTFGDTKEGMFGVRMSPSIDVDHGSGHILNSRGDKNRDAWGKRAEWCDYSGTLNGDTVGITIMDHPSNFRYPTYWHVRTYGLFAANPFGVKDFTGAEAENGRHTIPKGGKISFRYRIIVHTGEPDKATLDAAFRKFAASAQAQHCASSSPVSTK